jgi:hypothetical protein
MNTQELATMILESDRPAITKEMIQEHPDLLNAICTALDARVAESESALKTMRENASLLPPSAAILFEGVLDQCELIHERLKEATDRFHEIAAKIVTAS